MRKHYQVYCNDIALSEVDHSNQAPKPQNISSNLPSYYNTQAGHDSSVYNRTPLLALVVECSNSIMDFVILVALVLKSSMLLHTQ